MGSLRIIPVSKWLVTPIYKPWKGHLEGEQPYLGNLQTMVINHWLIGMILQIPLASFYQKDISTVGICFE